MELQDNQFQKQRKMPRRSETETEVCGFIQKLWDILQNPSFHKILLWNNCGKSFAIVNPSLLEQQILPAYFRHSKLKSFVRQLNMYDFKKSQRDKEVLVFFNRNFIRNQQFKLLAIRRKLSKRIHRQRRTAQYHRQIDGIVEFPNDLSHSPQIMPDSKQLAHAQTIQITHQDARSAMQIKSYGRLIEDCSSLIPLISPYSYASIKSERRELSKEQSEGRSLMDLDLFKVGSTNVEDAWGCGFTSCQYFL